MTRGALLLVGDLRPDEMAAWHATLTREMPDEVVHLATEPFAGDTVEIAILANPPPGSLRGLSGLRWMHGLWAGVDRLLQDETLPDVPLVRLVDPAMAQAMAEAVAAAVLFIHRDLPVYAAQQRRREWRQHPAPLAGARTVCVLGLGEMGQAAAAHLVALGFAVRGWSRTRRDLPGVQGFAGADGFTAALDGADILVNLLPLTTDTAGILNRAAFAQLAPGAALVNFGRGRHLDEADLLAALDEGRLSHAVLDVFAVEPLPAAHPFWQHPGVTVLPHVAAPTGRDTAAALVAAAVRRYRETGQPPAGLDRGRGY